jgi:hypothetical protein
MSEGASMEIALEGGRTAFRPGETVEGTVAWSLPERPVAVELRVFWSTRGKGTEDVGVAHVEPMAGAMAEERRPFRLALPVAPWSYDGRLVAVVWGMELVALPSKRSVSVEIVIGPGAAEVRPA